MCRLVHSVNRREGAQDSATFRLGDHDVAFQIAQVGSYTYNGLCNRIEQDYGGVKKRQYPMHGFDSLAGAAQISIWIGIETTGEVELK
jgi:transposase-like protein